MQLIGVVFALLLGFVFGLAYRPAREAYREHFTVVSLEIVGVAMADPQAIVEGAPFNFTVVARNKALRIVPDKGVTVSVDAPLGTVTVGDDGSAGVFTAGGSDGSGNLVATDGAVTSAPFPIVVTPDNVVASLEVVPA